MADIVTMRRIPCFFKMPEYISQMGYSNIVEPADGRFLVHEELEGRFVSLLYCTMPILGKREWFNHAMGDGMALSPGRTAGSLPTRYPSKLGYRCSSLSRRGEEILVTTWKDAAKATQRYMLVCVWRTGQTLRLPSRHSRSKVRLVLLS